jgi:hypothetical protein
MNNPDFKATLLTSTLNPLTTKKLQGGWRPQNGLQIESLVAIAKIAKISVTSTPPHEARVGDPGLPKFKLLTF